MSGDMAVALGCFIITVLLAFGVTDKKVECPAPVAKKLLADMTKTQKRHWVNYYVNRSGS